MTSGMDKRKASLLVVVALAGASVSAHAYPGQKFIQKRAEIIRQNRARALRTKQQAMLIAGNTTLKAVRDAKILEHKASAPIGGMTTALTLASSGLLTALAHGDVRYFLATSAVVGTEITLMMLHGRHGAAKEYAHEETLKYAKAHGIELAPPKLRESACV